MYLLCNGLCFYFRFARCGHFGQVGEDVQNLAEEEQECETAFALMILKEDLAALEKLRKYQIATQK